MRHTPNTVCWYLHFTSYMVQQENFFDLSKTRIFYKQFIFSLLSSQLFPKATLFSSTMSAEDCTAKKQKTEESAKTTRTATLHPYIYFPGTARQAIEFYAKVFDAKEPFITTFKDMPGDLPEEVPVEHVDKVMHACLTWGEGNVMMFADDSNCETTTPGNNVQLSISMSDVDEMTKMFNALAEGGEVKMPLMKQFWGATYGKLVDRFGITWGFNCQDEPAPAGTETAIEGAVAPTMVEEEVKDN